MCKEPSQRENPEGEGEAIAEGRAGVQGRGPFVYLYLAHSGGKVTRAWFETYGCPSAIRCSDWLAKWAGGRELDSLSVIEPKDLEAVVGGLPRGKEFCASLAVDALRDAVGAARGFDDHCK